MKIAVLTGCLDDFMPLGKRTIYENKAEYCERHGYHLEIIREVRGRYRDPRSHARGFSWSRLEHLLEMVSHGYFDWIWVVGADTIVTSMRVRLEDIVATALTPEAEKRPLPICPTFKGYHIPDGIALWPRNGERSGKKSLIITGECVTSLQADSFLVRSGPDGAEWVRDILSCYPKYKHSSWAEQLAMMDRIEKHAALTCIVPQHVMNSYLYQVWRPRGPRYATGLDAYGNRGQWKPGDFLLHFAGMGMRLRLILLKRYWPKIIR